MRFKLSYWTGLINWTHLLQSERHAKYVDSFVCSGVIKVSESFNIRKDNIFERKIVNIFLFISFNICFGCLGDRENV